MKTFLKNYSRPLILTLIVFALSVAIMPSFVRADVEDIPSNQQMTRNQIDEYVASKGYTLAIIIDGAKLYDNLGPGELNYLYMPGQTGKTPLPGI